MFGGKKEGRESSYRANLSGAGGAQKQSREMKELAEMRKRSLNTPLSEKARPAKMNEVIGQEEGIRRCAPPCAGQTLST